MTESPASQARPGPEAAIGIQPPSAGADVIRRFLTDVGAGPDAASSGESPAQAPICSSRGCRSDAVWAVLWNNPKLHTPERRKIWIACEQHREHLADFLRLRGFLREVRPLNELGQASDPGSAAPPAASGDTAE